MTRKDYKLIAEVLQDTNAKPAQCLAMANALHRASGYTPNGNKSFDNQKFLIACGVASKV